MKIYLLICKSFVEFILFKITNSKKWFAKSLNTYKKNYFSIVHSGDLDMNQYLPTIQYMLSNILKKNIENEDLLLSADFFSYCTKQQAISNSQFLQDLFVIYFLGEKENGYFVEFGACDGIDLSNTLVLEKKFKWTGILAEPDKYYFGDLVQNRNCFKSNLAVYKSTGLELKFAHVSGDSKLSTINNYISKDAHTKSRINKEIFDVKTISLDDLLDSFDAPEIIDYASVDTEGSEFDILKSFSFKRQISLWTIEHNHNQKIRNLVLDIMNKNGYKRVLEGFAECDDWFIKNDCYEKKIVELKSCRKDKE